MARKSVKKKVLETLSLHGELFWEYRAKTAEYEKALLELSIASKELKEKLSYPEYKVIEDLFIKQEELQAQLKKQAEILRGAQIKASNKLGVSIEKFLTQCFIDYETGVVRIFE